MLKLFTNTSLSRERLANYMVVTMVGMHSSSFPHVLVADFLLVGHSQDVYLVNNVKSQDWLIGDYV